MTTTLTITTVMTISCLLLRTGLASVIELADRICVGLGTHALINRNDLAYFTVLLVVLQQSPSFRVGRLQCAKFVVCVCSSTARFVNLGAALIPIGQGALRFLEKSLVFRAYRLG